MDYSFIIDVLNLVLYLGIGLAVVVVCYLVYVLLKYGYFKIASKGEVDGSDS